VFLAVEHPGIPDAEILDKLLDPHSVLLTGDRVLHNLALGRLSSTSRRRIRPFRAAGRIR
jgi:hypothetical protein